MASFGVPAWAAWAADVFSEYAPFSWVACGLLGMLILASAYALFGYAKGRIQVAKFQARVSEAAFINPLARTFERVRIRVTDLSPPLGNIIANKSFTDCDIIGPANVVFFECSFSGTKGEAVDGLIIRDGLSPRNGFGFSNCTFADCRFYLLTIMVPEQEFEKFARFNWGGLNWITEVPTPDLFGGQPETAIDNQSSATE